MTEPPACRGCGAPVRFVPSNTPGGKTMCLEASPSARGNVWLRDVGEGLRAQVVGTDAAKALRAGGEPLYLSHHATCPKASEYRRA